MTSSKAVVSRFQEHLWVELQQFSVFVDGNWPIHSHPYGCLAYSWTETSCYKGLEPHQLYVSGHLGYSDGQFVLLFK